MSRYLTYTKIICWRLQNPSIRKTRFSSSCSLAEYSIENLEWARLTSGKKSPLMNKLGARLDESHSQSPVWFGEPRSNVNPSARYLNSRARFPCIDSRSAIRSRTMIIRNRMGEVEGKPFRHHPNITFNNTELRVSPLNIKVQKTGEISISDSIVNEGNAFQPHLSLLSQLYVFLFRPRPICKERATIAKLLFTWSHTKYTRYYEPFLLGFRLTGGFCSHFALSHILFIALLRDLCFNDNMNSCKLTDQGAGRIGGWRRRRSSSMCSSTWSPCPTFSTLSSMSSWSFTSPDPPRAFYLLLKWHREPAKIHRRWTIEERSAALSNPTNDRVSIFCLNEETQWRTPIYFDFSSIIPRRWSSSCVRGSVAVWLWMKARMWSTFSTVARKSIKELEPNSRGL